MKQSRSTRTHRGLPEGRRFSPLFLVVPLAIFALASPVLRSQEKPAVARNSDLERRLDTRLADPDLSASIIGIKVVRLETGETVYERNAGKLFHPASNMKLLTTAAALSTLPEGHRFRTTVYCDYGIVDSVLGGNLYIRGCGDPLMEVSDLDSVAGMVHSAGIRKIAGSVIGDVTLFDTLRWGKGWMWDDEPEPEEAFLTPLTLHGNSVTLTIVPGQNPGDSLRYEVEPRTRFLSVENSARTLPPGVRDTLIVTREAGNNRILLAGGLDAGSLPRKRSLSVHEPALMFLETLKERLALRGVENDRPVMLDSTRGKIFLGAIERPLDSVLFLIHKESDNIAAENLLKYIGARNEGAPGSGRSGLRVVEAYLSSIGADPRTVILADGSGVSWYNAVTPDIIVGVLRDRYRNQNSFRRFLRSLPVGGYDGTLKNRFARSSARGRVFAKTGAITGASTLSGYLYTGGHELFGFSIMVNHFPGRTARLRDLQETLLEELVRLPAGE